MRHTHGVAIEQRVNAYLEQVREGRLAKADHCQRCGKPGHLRWHGSYLRSLIALGKKYFLPIKRLYCTLCEQTFALLPPFVAKWHRYAVEVIDFAINALKSTTFGRVAEQLMEEYQHYVAIETLYLWRIKFA